MMSFMAIFGRVDHVIWLPAGEDQPRYSTLQRRLWLGLRGANNMIERMLTEHLFDFEIHSINVIFAQKHSPFDHVYGQAQDGSTNTVSWSAVESLTSNCELLQDL